MKKLSFVISVVFTVACSDRDRVPEGILPKQQMQAVLWDMIRAGEFLEVYVFSRDTAIDKNAKALEWYDNVYRLHRVSKASFEKSYAWYRDHPLVMKEVLDSLSKKQETFSQPPPPVAIDTGSLDQRDSQNKKQLSSPVQDRPLLLADSTRKDRRMLQKEELRLR